LNPFGEDVPGPGDCCSGDACWNERLCGPERPHTYGFRLIDTQ